MSIANLLKNNNNPDIEQKIVEELLNEKNLDTKTDLSKPLNWSALNTVLDYLKDKGLKRSADILKEFKEITFKFLISRDRKGRLEYLQALQSIQEHKDVEQQSKLQKPHNMVV